MAEKGSVRRSKRGVLGKLFKDGEAKIAFQPEPGAPLLP